MAEKARFHQTTYGVGTRLKRPPSDEMVDFFQEVYLAGLDEEAFQVSIDVSLAHVVMLAEEDIISRRDAALLLAELLRLLETGLSGLPIDSHLGDVLPNLENHLIARLGDEVGGRFHTGRSRGDYYVATSRLKFRQAALRLADSMLAFRAVILELAEAHVETLMPGYTHMQHAQAITLAHYLLSVAHQLERDSERLSVAADRANLNPLGLGIIATSSFPLNRDRTAGLLGFRGLVRNGRDLIDRDYVLELASAAAITMIHLHKLATDLYDWSTSEFGFVTIADEDAMTSSMMPQKANPVLLELVRARTGSVIGAVAAGFATLKGSPANNIEASSSDAHGLGALHETQRTLAGFGPVLARLTFDRDRMAALAGSHWTQATDLADLLVREAGISFREAHRVVGAVVKASIDGGVPPREVTTALVDSAALVVLGRPIGLSAGKLAEALDPWLAIHGRRLPGGPAPEVVRPALAAVRRQLDADAARLAAARAELRTAREELLRVSRRTASG